MSAIAAPVGPGSDVRSATRRATIGLGLIVGATIFGLLAGVLGAQGKAIDVVGLGLVFLPVALWKRPHIGPIVMLCVAVLFEQVVTPGSMQAGWVPGVGDVLPPPPLVITSHVHVFEGLGSLHLEAADLLLFLIAVVFLVRTKPADRGWPHSHVSRSMAWLLGAVMLGVFIGVSHHGQIRQALMETRPYVYLAAAYVLTAALIRTRSAMRNVLWAFVIATGLKAAQGVYEFFLVMSWHPRPEAVMGHEDAYTFAVYIFFVATLWLFHVEMGKLRKVATWLLPLIFAANLFNNRRAAWLMLGGGLIVLIVIGWRCLPEKRHKLKKLVIGLLLFSAVYVPAYWNKTGTLAQPARALHSMISPDTRDAASNLYRTQEDANLKFNIREGGILGRGFGVPIDYALPIVDISKTDPEIKFIPHNGVLYIPMRMGLLGTIVFWTLLGTAIITGCRLAKSREREMAVVGALLACALVAYALEGATDQGFFFYRIAFITGVLLGLAEAARRIQRTNPLAVHSWVTAPSAVAVPAAAELVSAGVAEVPSDVPERVPVAAVSAAEPPPRLTFEPLPADRRLRTNLALFTSSDGHPPLHAVSPPVDPGPVTIVSSNPATGAASEIGRLAERLGTHGVAELVLLKRRRQSEEPLPGHGHRTSWLNARGPFAVLRSAASLRRRLRKEGPALVYADGDRAALVSVIACRRNDIPIVWRRDDLARRRLLVKLIGRRCHSQITEDDVAASASTPPRDRVRVGSDDGYDGALDSDVGVILAAIRACAPDGDSHPPAE